MQYGKEEGEFPSLLHTPLDPDLEELPQFIRSLLQTEFEDVEPTSAIMARIHELEEVTKNVTRRSTSKSIDNNLWSWSDGGLARSFGRYWKINLWNYGKKNAELIDEPRLVQKLRQTLQVPNLVLQNLQLMKQDLGVLKKAVL